MTTKTKEELFHLTQAEADMTEQDAQADPSPSPVFTWIWRYQVPVDRKLTFKPGHTFALYGGDFAATDKIRVEVRDANELEKKVLIDRALYTTVDSFTDRDTMYRLDINAPVVAGPSSWIVILAIAAATIDASASYFDLTCDRERQAIL